MTPDLSISQLSISRLLFHTGLFHIGHFRRLYYASIRREDW